MGELEINPELKAAMKRVTEQFQSGSEVEFGSPAAPPVYNIPQVAPDTPKAAPLPPAPLSPLTAPTPLPPATAPAQPAPSPTVSTTKSIRFWDSEYARTQLATRQAEILPPYSQRQAKRTPKATAILSPDAAERPDAASVLPPVGRHRTDKSSKVADLGRSAFIGLGNVRAGATKSPEDREPGNRRRLAIVGGIALATTVTVVGLYMNHKGHGPIPQAAAPSGHEAAVVPPVAPPQPTTVAAVAGHHHAVSHAISADRVNVLPGQGVTDGIGQYAGTTGHEHVTGQQKYRIFLRLSKKLHGHFFKNDPSYPMGGPNFGISRPGVAEWNPAAEHIMDNMLAHL